MLVRLAFAVMIQVDADILLIDEVLAVGDAAFQQKCFDEFERIRAQRRDGPARHARHGAPCSRFCDRAMLLERGPRRRDRRARARRQALPRAELLRERAASARAATGASRADRADAGREPRPCAAATARAEIVEAWFEDERRRARRRRSTTAAGARSRRACASASAVEDPLFGVVARGRPRATRAAPRTTLRRTRTPAASRPARRSTIAFAFDNLLAPGRYCATPAVAHAGTGERVDRPPRARSLLVHGHADIAARSDASSTPYDVRSSSAPRSAVAVSAPPAPPRAARRSRARRALGSDPRRLWQLTPARWRSPTSSCASSARCSATCGSSCGR